MNRFQNALGVLLLLSAGNALAQTATNTFPASGNVGIGTTNPLGVLDVNQSTSGPGIHIDANNVYGATIDLYNTYTGGNAWSVQAGRADTSQTGVTAGSLVFTNITASTLPMVITPAGNVGIGTTAPSGTLDVSGLNGAGGYGGLVVSGVNLDPRGSYSLVPLQNSGKLLEGWNMGQGVGEIDLISNRGGGNSGGFRFYDYSNSGVLTPLLSLLGAGNVGIGTTTPGAKLEVSGNILLTSGSGASITFPDGTKQGTAWTGMTCGGDYAESMDVSGDRTHYEPGDVLVIGAESGSDVVKSSEPYSTLVVGVYSTKPGVIGRRQTTDSKASTTEVPMAMVGVVPTKVSAENGPIKRGDLLVTSSASGYAMKGTDRSRMLGAVIGKALGHLDSGTGKIEVVVTLQ